MIRPLAPLLVVALLTPALGQNDDPELGESSRIDMSGIWRSEKTDLVVRRLGISSWIGYPTDIGGATSGRTWHFQALGDDFFKFWIILEGKATTQKLDEQSVRVRSRGDEMALKITERREGAKDWKWRRVCAPVPRKLGEVVVSFTPRGKTRVPPDQDVDTRLVRILERAVPAARAADHGLKRINVAATIDVPLGRAHSRFLRRAIAIDKVNGADASHWREDVKTKLKFISAGEAPDVDPRRDYARHALALVLCLLADDEVESVVCPAILSKDSMPYVEWWLRQYGRGLPRHSPSIPSWRKKLSILLEETGSARGKLKDWLQVTVKPAEGVKPVKRKSMDERYDRK